MTCRAREAFGLYAQERRAHWDTVARHWSGRRDLSAGYRHRLVEVYTFLIPRGQRVLELGCGCGDLLASLQPKRGVGIDFSEEMIRLARERHPGLEFLKADVHDLHLNETFDVIIASDLLNDLWDIQHVLASLQPLCHPGTRLILNSYSRLWQIPLTLARTLGLIRPVLQQNWLTRHDVADLLQLAGFEVLREFQEVLWPFRTPVLGSAFNRILVKLWPLNHLAVTNVTVARPFPRPRSSKTAVSVIIPARNEAGNIPEIFARVPEMGSGTELVFVEGHSRDGTAGAIEDGIRQHPHRRCLFLQQDGVGKGDAVRLGFARSSGDVLMILDADLTVAPEDLPRFFAALVNGQGELINGVRLVYPMEDSAMRYWNFLGNKFFSLVFTALLGQPVKDTLCGTKVLYRSDYDRIAKNRAFLGNLDPFGDFDLLFGAARIGLKILDLPIRYGRRSYGTTNISRWRHGWLLLRMAWLAARRLRFV